MTVKRILAETEVLLLDFDGPICSVFASLPAPVVADRLRANLDDPLPRAVSTTKDPFEVLIHASTIGVDIEQALRDQEVEAVHGAEPTAGSHDLIRAWKATGRPVAIVSTTARQR